jgi:hypothetical protein
VDSQDLKDVGLRGRLAPSPATSALYRTLCQADGSGRCTFPDEVVLTTTLPCDGKECSAGESVNACVRV